MFFLIDQLEMNDKSLYQKILGISFPWEVGGVDVDIKKNRVIVSLNKISGVDLPCPHCNKYYPIYDNIARSWRHLDTCQLETIIDGFIPRVSCEE